MFAYNASLSSNLQLFAQQCEQLLFGESQRPEQLELGRQAWVLVRPLDLADVLGADARVVRQRVLRKLEIPAPLSEDSPERDELWRRVGHGVPETSTTDGRDTTV